MPSPANLILILAESHSQRLLGCDGDPIIQTPNLDRLAARGTRFADTYCTSPICVPSRASIATGLYPHQNRYWENSMPFEGGTRSWMKHLREAGNEVAVTGKLHFRSEGDDNGFSEEIDTMHIAEGVGELIGLLRSSGEEPVRGGKWDLYTVRTGVGDVTHYQDYDRRITAHAVKWLNARAERSGKPWVLCVHYVSAHPPFVVPQRFYDLYAVEDMPAPVQFSAEERPRHPAIEHLRRIMGHADTLDETLMKKITACYYAVITHLDEQVGELVAAVEASGLNDDTRIVYTADHGFSCGHQYVLSLFNLYQKSVSVPLIMAGPDVPEGRVVRQITSHVDLYPTILESVGERLSEDEQALPGISLWPALEGCERARLGFAEYHAAGSKTGAFMLREGKDKLIYHVGMNPQLFDLEADPDETYDIAATPEGVRKAKALEKSLRSIVDPEDADRQAKTDQRRKALTFGGTKGILELRDGFVYSPPPGVDWRGA